MSGMVDKLDGLHVETRNLGKDLYLSRPIQHAPLAAHLRIPGEVADDRSVVALAHFVMQMTAAWPGIARALRAASAYVDEADRLKREHAVVMLLPALRGKLRDALDALKAAK